MRRALPCLTLKMESKYQNNRTGKEVCYLIYFGFLDTETFTVKGSFVFRRIYFSTHPRARVWDISISLNCVVITLFLLLVFQFLRDFNFDRANCFKHVDFLSPFPNRRNENTLKYCYIYLPHTFSLICYGYCYYRGESPISGHSMTRDCLKHYFEPCRSNESDFAQG